MFEPESQNKPIDALTRFRQTELRFLADERRQGEPWLEGLLKEQESPDAEAVLKKLGALKFQAFDEHFGGGRRKDEMDPADQLAVLYDYFQSSPDQRQIELEPEVINQVADALLRKAEEKAQEKPGLFGKQKIRRAKEELEDCKIIISFISGN